MDYSSAANGDDPLPCLNSYISTETHTQAPDPATDSVVFTSLPRLSTQHRRSAFMLKESVQKLAFQYGIQFLGFLTLTFADHVVCPKEAQRRLNSLITHVIKPRYRDYLGVLERQKSGRIHFHMLVALDSDIRTGVDFDELAAGKYTSASKNLRAEWAFWRQTAPKYRFGRTELLPIKSTIEAIAKYVGKYISKHIEARKDEDKGVRLVRYSRGARAGTTRFQFLSNGSAEWRRKLAIFGQIVQDQHPEQAVTCIEDLTRILGPNWAYKHREYILALP